VAISSSNSPRFEPNPNTGQPFSTDDKTEVATNTIYMNASHPSHILLPVASHQPAKK
jgi:predicted acyl esterase